MHPNVYGANAQRNSLTFLLFKSSDDYSSSKIDVFYGFDAERANYG